MILDAWGWCTGTTQRDGMGREEGGGLWQIHFDIWQNQYNIVKLNKIKLKKIIIQILHKLVATGLEKVSFHSQSLRKAMPKNAQTTAQLH